jgi:hypothetical protein
VPENQPRIIAAAQARVDFYDALRGHPEVWTEIDYAEAEASLIAADTWDAANGVLRIPIDDSLRDRLADAVHEGDLGEDRGTSSQTILDAVLAVLTATPGI